MGTRHRKDDGTRPNRKEEGGGGREGAVPARTDTFFHGEKKNTTPGRFLRQKPPAPGDPFDWVLKVQCMVSGNPNSLLQKKKIDGIGRKGKESLRTDDRVF